MTVGVRLAAFDREGRVFLVRHTYLPGWALPGGGVDRGETTVQAAKREAREEGNLEMTGPLRLVGIYFNRAERRDHVAFYECRSAFQTAPRQPDYEIAESGFFALDALPETTTPATRRRLAELNGSAPLPEEW